MDPHRIVRDARTSGDDSALRVYADWLEQQGDLERAQLVHLQCELARLGPFDRRVLEVRAEIVLLLAEHGERWRAELPILPGVTWTDFDLGFAVAVRVPDLATLARSADEIAAAAPVSRADVARLDDSPDPEPEMEGGGFTPTPEIEWLRELRIHEAGVNARVPASVRVLEILATDDDLGWLGQQQTTSLESVRIVDSTAVGRELIESIAAKRWAKSITSLDLATRYVDDNSGYADDPRLGADDGKTLAKLTRLERLTINRHRIGAAALRTLIGALPRLRALSARECNCSTVAFKDGAPLVELDLSRNAIGSNGAREIASSSRCRELQSLVLDTCEIETLGVSDLIAAPLWHTLRRLDLSRNPLGASAIRTLAAAPPPAQLHTLLLADVDLDDGAITALGKVPWLGSLTTLDLSGNILGRGAVALRSIAPEALRSLAIGSIGLERAEAAAIARFWPRLVELELSGNALTDAGLERFTTMKEAAALQKLGLHDCALTDDGLELLATRARCPRLRVLDLAGNRFGAGLLPLLRAPFASRLEELDLARCGLSGTTIAMLAKAPLPPRLRRLSLRGNDLDQASLVALAESPTLRQLDTLELDASPWTLPDHVRDQLAQRFGPRWYQH